MIYVIKTYRRQFLPVLGQVDGTVGTGPLSLI